MLETLAYGAIAIFFAFACLNGFTLVRNSIKRDRYVSMVPIIGGVSGVLGFALTPGLRAYAWVPLILDIGTALALIFGVPFFLWELWRTSTVNLVSAYEAHTAKKHVALRLFRGGYFVLTQRFHREKKEIGLVETSTCGTWSVEHGTILLKRGENQLMMLSSQNFGSEIRVGVGFSNDEGDSATSLNGISLKLSQGTSVGE